MPIRFFYFDLGKVLLDFDMARMVRQMSDVSARRSRGSWRRFSKGGSSSRPSRARYPTGEFHEAFCRQTGTRPDYDRTPTRRKRHLRAQSRDGAAGEPVSGGGPSDGHPPRTPAGAIGSIAPGRYRILTALFDVGR